MIASNRLLKKCVEKPALIREASSMERCGEKPGESKENRHVNINSVSKVKCQIELSTYFIKKKKKHYG